jgi:KaiC/GvpD/RAD55 family RecA-like ATPase
MVLTSSFVGDPEGQLRYHCRQPRYGQDNTCSSVSLQAIKDYNEKGLYMSIMEEKKKFLNNMKRFGFDFEALEQKGMFKMTKYSIFSTFPQFSVSFVNSQNPSIRSMQS